LVSIGRCRSLGCAQITAKVYTKINAVGRSAIAKMKRFYSPYLQYSTLHAIAFYLLTTIVVVVPAVSIMAKAASVTILRLSLSVLRLFCINLGNLPSHVPVNDVTVSAPQSQPMMQAIRLVPIRRRQNTTASHCLSALS
jgi:hypothetical protein